MDKSTHDEPISVLLIDDDEEDYIIIKHIFQCIADRPFTLEWCGNFEKAKQLIDDHSFSIYLIDYRLGAHNGFDLLKHADPQKRIEPFIMLTGMGDRETEKRSMILGAADYLIKGTFGPELLSRTLHYSFGRKQIEQQRVEYLLDLNRAKDEFISLASHQLRTPATGVKQYLGMVLEGFAGDITTAQHNLLRKAYESNERQLNIVSDLLKVAQVDAGKVLLRKTETDIGAMMSDVIKEQSKVFKDRRQTVDFTAPNVPISALIDTDRIRMVMENILDNASKYSDHGTTINVTVGETKTLTTVAIQDHGVGISDADRDKLFAKFSRIYNPLSTQVGGTGLGLYWAHKIVELHGGSIDVISQESQGTTFVINLPKLPTSGMLKEDNHSKKSDNVARKS